MKVSDFDYYLPEELIAQTPVEPRDSSRLLKLDKQSGSLSHHRFRDIVDFLGPNDVLVVNRTKVINARLKGQIETGLDVEIFLHKKINEHTWDCLVYPWKKLKVGTEVTFSNNLIKMKAAVKEVSHSGRIVEFSLSGDAFENAIESLWETPLPPYIKEKSPTPERYQTVYSQEKGSVAAPTAWLHFTQELFEKLKAKWVQIEEVLLHVGLGTFKWVEVDNVKDHVMHSEFCSISNDTAHRLNAAKKSGKRIIAVWTTSVRTLESFASESGNIQSWEKETDIFIYPWYKWRFVDSIITNFHLPKSTLLMLISSFAGEENIKKAYEEAIKGKYRFFSFGDAMWLE